MSPTDEVRPLPASLALAAFPTAYEAEPDPASLSGRPFFIVRASADEVEVGSMVEPWLTLSQPRAVADGISRIDYSAKENTYRTRQLTVPVTVRGKPYQVEFTQQGGYLSQDETQRVLSSPLNIDFLVAITFIAKQVKKIPMPYRLIAIVVVVLAIVAIGFAIAVARHAFINVPEPKPLSQEINGDPMSVTVIPNVEISGALPLPFLAVEDQMIALQTVKELYWFIKQVL